PLNNHRKYIRPSLHHNQQHQAKMSHAALSQEARDERGISNSLLRLSVGLENVDDLISDFENALSYVEEPVNA
ncbi:PLP-dependent transferase, partial [Bacillus cereus]|uniref:PLP-dependent transferase n=1 Tax=Bacillus cereus TaxID=1396 RepID=UPI0020CF2F5B|nr:PLP-dependent transferase [Bacillus cereus]